MTGLDQIRARLARGEALAANERAIVLQLLEKVAPLTRAADMRARDGVIRELARVHLRHLPSRSARASRIAALADAYARGAWLRDRQSATCPERLQDRPEALLWRCFKLSAEFPFSSRQIFRIIE